MCMCSLAGGIGFWFYQNQKVEKEKRDNEMRGGRGGFYDEDYMESGGRRGGRRGRRGRRTTSSGGGRSTTRTKTTKTGRTKTRY